MTPISSALDAIDAINISTAKIKTMADLLAAAARDGEIQTKNIEWACSMIYDLAELTNQVGDKLFDEAKKAFELAGGAE